MAKYDDLDTKQIFIIGIASVVVTVVTILAAQYVYYLLVDADQARLQAESNYNRQNRILVEQFEDVSRYGADPETGKVVIPIDAAMKLVAEGKQSTANTKSNNATENDAT